MKLKRAIMLGIAIWGIGVMLYTASYLIPVMENMEDQANMVLFIAIIPLVWFGSSIYYKKDQKTHGYILGQTMLLTAVVLDALITVPVLIMPTGGSHYSFFTSFGFWVIAAEFLAVSVLYWYIRVYPLSIKTKK